MFFNIAFYTGARKGEIHALKWSDIEDNVFAHQAEHCAEAQGRRQRDAAEKLKLNTRFAAAERADCRFGRAQTAMQGKHKKIFSDDFRICGAKTCLRDTSLSKRNVRYSSLAGVKTIRIHDFRHTHASLLANEGINIQEIARRLGHSKIEITWNIYSHLYPREEERAVAVLDSI